MQLHQETRQVRDLWCLRNLNCSLIWNTNALPECLVCRFSYLKSEKLIRASEYRCSQYIWLLPKEMNLYLWKTRGHVYIYYIHMCIPVLMAKHIIYLDNILSTVDPSLRGRLKQGGTSLISQYAQNVQEPNGKYCAEGYQIQWLPNWIGHNTVERTVKGKYCMRIHY